MISFECPRCKKIIRMDKETISCPNCGLPKKDLFSAASEYSKQVIAGAKKHARKVNKEERANHVKTSSMALPMEHWKLLKVESNRRKKEGSPNSKMYEIMAEALDKFFKIRRP